MDKSLFDGQTRSGRVARCAGDRLGFNAFVPTDLQEVRVLYSDRLVKILGEAREALGGTLEKWRTTTDEERKRRLESVLDREADASVRLARDILSPTSNESERLISFSSGVGTLNFDLAPCAEPPLAGKDLDDKKQLKESFDYAIERMAELPLSLRLVEELHDFVMHAPHNYEKNPGEFRRSPIWIGARDATPSTAAFVPPAPDDMKSGLFRLEEYIHAESKTDALIRAALVHCQFEILHPFLDGNGRVGRLLTSLCLIDWGTIPAPIPALSPELKKRETQYYRAIWNVETLGDYEQFIAFWLESFRDACRADL